MAAQNRTATSPTIAGDENTGVYRPDAVGSAVFDRLDRGLLDRLAALPGLTGTTSDVLDELGVDAAVGASVLVPRGATRGVAGHALTLRYRPAAPGGEDGIPRLAHHVVLGAAVPGDVMVIEVNAGDGVPPSVFGGVASLAAVQAQLGGLVVDGAIRDVDEVRSLGLAAWSRYLTPRTGKQRLEAAEINGPVTCAGLLVTPGDLVVADATGVCVVPAVLAGQVAGRALEVAGREAELFAAARDGAR